jgi:tRNA threonylcarbamoyladenosine biosynthesis protein TsaB
MLILALDTSGEVCSVAISRGNSPLMEYNFRHFRRLTERLPDIISFVLRDSGHTLRDIEGFAVGLGPGSFTGVRIGVTTAKTFAFATDKAIVGISSLDAIALNPAVLSRHRIAIAPTRRLISIAAFYPAGAMSSLEPPVVMQDNEIVPKARQMFGENPIFLMGEGASVVLSSTEFKQDILPVDAFPSASRIAEIAFHRFENGATDNADTLTPLYVSPPPTG